MGLHVEGAVQMTRGEFGEAGLELAAALGIETDHQQPEGVGDGNRLRPLICFPAS